jgi:MGT family glycosyltransferase
MQRLVETGHDVTWLAGRAFVDRAARAGVRHVAPRHALDLSAMDDPFDALPELRGKTGVAAIRAAFRDVFIPQALEEIIDIEEIIDAHGADVLVSCGPNYGAGLVGERLGLPVATLGDGPFAITDPDLPPFGPGLAYRGGATGRLRNRLVGAAARRGFADVHRAYRDVRVAAGLAADSSGPFDALVSPVLHLQGCVPGFEFPMRRRPDSVHFVGALRPMAPLDWRPPSWWAEVDGRRPIVHLTQGTIRPDPAELVRPVIDVLADEDVLVVATIGSMDPEHLGPVPPNVRWSPFIPYDELLARASVFVTNGGYIGTNLALHHGVPVVQIGDTEEKAETGTRINHAGVGVARKRRPTGRELRDVIVHAMTDETIAANVRRVAAEYQDHDAPVEAAGLLVDLASDWARRRKSPVPSQVGD